MRLDDLTADEVRQQVARITGSRRFARSDRLIRFLRFVVDRALEGDTGSIQEYAIGREVYDRRESFDPAGDSIVRVEARRLRRRLAEYYASEGARDRILIELPGRGYMPVVQRREVAPDEPVWVSRPRNRIIAAVLTVSAAAVGLFLLSSTWEQRQANGYRSLGVLPFSNYTNDASQDYFADGLIDCVVADLTQIRALRVISRTTMMQYRNAGKPAPKIGRELGVEYLIEGSVSKAENRIRVTVQLIHAPTDKYVWARSYEAASGMTLDVQRAMVADIVDRIAVNLSPAEKAVVQGRPTGNPVAYEALLKGIFAWNQWTGAGAAAAISYFRAAVEQDPGFALAWAWLAAGYRQSIWMGDAPSRQTLAAAKSAALKAIEIAPALAAGHHSHGLGLTMEGQWERAESELVEAIRLEPGNPLFHHGYGILCLAPQRRLEEAEAEIRKAVRIDPASLTNKVVLAKVLHFAGRNKDAEAQLREVLRLDPNYADGWRNLGQVLCQTGEHAAAIAALRRAQELAPLLWGEGLLAYAHALRGDSAEASRILGRLQAGRPGRAKPALAMAAAYCGLRSPQEALRWLGQAIDHQDVRAALINVDPVFDSLRSHPDFEKLLRRLRLR